MRGNLNFELLLLDKMNKMSCEMLQQRNKMKTLQNVIKQNQMQKVKSLPPANRLQDPYQVYINEAYQNEASHLMVSPKKSGFVSRKSKRTRRQKNDKRKKVLTNSAQNILKRFQKIESKFDKIDKENRRREKYNNQNVQERMMIKQQPKMMFNPDYINNYSAQHNIYPVYPHNQNPYIPKKQHKLKTSKRRNCNSRRRVKSKANEFKERRSLMSQTPNSKNNITSILSVTKMKKRKTIDDFYMTPPGWNIQSNLMSKECLPQIMSPKNSNKTQIGKERNTDEINRYGDFGQQIHFEPVKILQTKSVYQIPESTPRNPEKPPIVDRYAPEPEKIEKEADEFNIYDIIKEEEELEDSEESQYIPKPPKSSSLSKSKVFEETKKENRVLFWKMLEPRFKEFAYRTPNIFIKKKANFSKSVQKTSLIRTHFVKLAKMPKISMTPRLMKFRKIVWAIIFLRRFGQNVIVRCCILYVYKLNCLLIGHV